jgi:hypothetical protein
MFIGVSLSLTVVEIKSWLLLGYMMRLMCTVPIISCVNKAAQRHSRWLD